MELADSYDTLAEVPADHLALYVEKDGKYVLALTGLKTQGDFDRYAEALKARLADQTADLKASQNAGLSRDEILAAIKEAAAPPKPNGDGQGTGDQIDPATAAQVHDLQRQLAAVTEQLATEKGQRETAQATAQTTTIKTALTGAAVKAGVRPEAVDSLVQLVQDSFEQAADGSIVVKLEGNKIAGVTPNSKPEDALAIVKRASEFSYFWPDSKGSGGQGGGNGGGGGGAGADNPWSKDGWNLTKQGQAVTSDRAAAEALATAAGSSIGAVKPPD